MLNTLAGIIASSGGGVATSYESIATVTVGAGGSSLITFSSIASTYQHLQIRAIARSNRAGTSGDAVVVRFNSDSGSNYANHELQGDGASAVAYAASSSTSWNYVERISSAGMTSGIFGSLVIDILDYANTNKYKTGRALGGVDANGSGQINFASGLWQSTSAISTITLAPSAGTSFDQYSSFALYGIKG